MKFALFIVAVAFLASPAFGKIYNRCSLAREMYYDYGVPKSELAIWTCIAEHESSYNTAAVGPPNYNGTNDYGIFQINDLYWCAPPSGKFSYNSCNTKCTNLTTDDIRESVTCARMVKSQQGWAAWSTWHFCSGALESIDNCF